MKKLITGLVLGAICCTLFGTPAFPLKYDPRYYHPPYAPTGNNSLSGDDSGWTDPHSAPIVPSTDGNIVLAPVRDYNIFIYIVGARLWSIGRCVLVRPNVSSDEWNEGKLDNSSQTTSWK